MVKNWLNMVKNGQEWAIVVNNGGITWYNKQEWMKNGHPIP